MVKCPKCNKDIRKLINTQEALIEWDYYKLGRYSKTPCIVDAFNSEWCCPECSETLFYDEQEAFDFLNNVIKEIEVEEENKVWHF